MLVLSFIYIIFDDSVDFHWSRSRILEKLSSLPQGTLPEGVQPAIGPDATGLGQIFEVVTQLREEADKRQVKLKKGIGLQHNVGGPAFGTSVVNILARSV